MILSFVLLSVFVFINVNFTEASEFAREDYTERMLGNPSENPFERLAKSLWRFDYIYFPAITILVSLFVAAFDKTRYRILLAVFALAPLLTLFLIAGSFSVRSLILATCYIGISILISLIMPKRKLLPAAI
jgi:hypothetical protein